MIIHGIQCNNCKDIIYSRAVHDFHWCSCEKCAIDGGLEYVRIVGNPEDWHRVEITTNDEITPKVLYNDWNQLDRSKHKFGTIKENKPCLYAIEIEHKEEKDNG